MIKIVCLQHFLLVYSMFYQFCNSHPLTNDSTCSNLLSNVEKSLQQALHYIYQGKESDFQLENADSGLTVPINETQTESHLHLPSNCLEIQLTQGNQKDGVYKVYPKGRTNPTPIQVYCDMKTSGGGWTIFQRRDDFGEPRENFFRNWSDYKNGFGSLNKEFWLGNDHISVLTLQDRMTLRIDLEGFDGSIKFAEYSDFRVKGEAFNYQLTFDEYIGNTGNFLTYNVNQNFATFDRDNENNCSKTHKSAWWYSNIATLRNFSNLNGIYLIRTRSNNCTFLHDFCQKQIEMKLRPQYFISKEAAD